jgi:ParB-like chromosome segregation protein Spo0J
MTDILNDGAGEMVPLGELTEHPRNANMGDLGAVIQSIEANGFYGALVVQRSTGHVLAGNHRLKAARSVGLERVPVHYVDVDDERALRILLADNRTTRLGMDDDTAIATILLELASTTEKLEGTGYDGEDLDALLRSISDGEDHAYGREKVTCPECGHQFVPTTTE